MPASGGPYWLRDLLILPPTPGVPIPPLPAHALGDHTDVDTTGETTGQYLRFDGTTWRPAAGGGGGGSGHFQGFYDIAGLTHPVPHLLGYKPAGVRAFSEDWQTQYGGLRIEHVDDNNLTVTVDQPFRGWIIAS